MRISCTNKTLHLPTEGAQSEADWERECAARIAKLNADAAARAESASRQAAEVVTQMAIAIGREMAQGDHNGHCRYAD